MGKLNAHSLPNCLLSKFSLIHNQAIDNANQPKPIIPYYRATTEKRSVLYEVYKLWNSEILVNAKLKGNIRSFCKQFQIDLLDLVSDIKSSNEHTEPGSSVSKFCHL